MIKRKKSPYKQLIAICLLTLLSLNVKSEGAGSQLYVQNCMVCHADDGSGAMPGVSDLTEVRTWSSMPENELLARLEKGIQKAEDAISMPPKGGNPELSDDDMKKIIIFMKAEFLN